MLWSILFLLAVAAAAYWWILRPVLRVRPDLKPHYDRLDGFWAMIGARLKGWRTIIVARLVQLAWAVVALHDAVIPQFAGIDWTPITTRMFAFIPPDYRVLALPLFGIACGIVMEWLRRITTGPVPGSIDEGAVR